jgi:two-component sensor histidine kinase
MNNIVLLLCILFLTVNMSAQTNTAIIDRLNFVADSLSEKNTDSALILAKKSQQLSKDSKYKKGLAVALNNLAVCNDIKGNSQIAIPNFISAIKLFEELKDDNSIAQCYSQMGICYFLQYQYDNALLYYTKAIEIYSKTNNKKDIAGVLINQGIVYTYIDKLNDAERNYLKALSIYKESNNKAGLSPTYNSLGKIYYDKKNFQRAIEYYKKSEEYSISINNQYNLIPTYNSLALCYKELKQHPEAKKYSEKSIEISKQIGALERELFCHETLAAILFDMGDYKNSFISQKNYDKLKDSLFTNDKNDAISEMQAKFDVETNRQKLKEIELQKQIDDEANTKQRILLIVVIIVFLVFLIFTILLIRNKQKVNLLLQQKNAAIQENLEQKEMMMGEIHHRVKNNLQMVSSILDLQARDLTDEKSIRVIEDSLSRINAISLIHQRLYQSENIRGIKINTYIQELAFDILKNFATSTTMPSVNLKCNIDGLDMDLESAIPIGLITAELITNACKYAFQNISKPEIIVSLNKKDDALILAISDNGIGKQSLSNNFGTSFGTKLIKSLSRKLRAEITEKSSSNGTCIKLKITNFKSYDN